MTRIDDTFARLKAEGKKAFVAYVMAGDPDHDTALQIVLGLPAAGVDIIELGMPFTDPMADGPTIQLSGQRALEGGQTLQKTLDMIDAGFFSPANVFDGKPIVERLLSDGEPYFVLADFAAYSQAQDAVDALYLQPDEWSRKAVLNALGMGTFSSDRSIREYAERIWRIKPVL